MGNYETITVLKSEYAVMERDAMKLAALEQAGVDNWEGYDFAMQLFRQWEEEEACHS